MKRILMPYVVGALVLFATGVMLNIPLQIGAPLAAQPGGLPASGPADPLIQLSDRFESIVSKVLPAVVSVEAVKPPKLNPGPKAKVIEESGSGVIVKSDVKPGYFVITNNHVVGLSKNEQVTIQLPDGRIFRPTAMYADPESDLAILAIDSPHALPTATLGNSDNARVGRWVLAAGSPFGLNQSVSHGIISRDRGQVTLGNTIRIKEFLQTDAAINPGSSGGPLIDLSGEVIGINTAIASHNGSNSGVAFSIPSNLVKRVMNQLLQQGAVQRGYLGMQLALTFDPNDALKLGLDRVKGTLVEKVYPSTPAATSGLQPQDVILQVENITIRNENHLINLISSLNAGQRIRMQVWRERSTTTLDATVGDWSKAQSQFRTDER